MLLQDDRVKLSLNQPRVYDTSHNSRDVDGGVDGRVDEEILDGLPLHGEHELPPS